MAEITLRKATKGDYQFLYELHLQSLREYIEQTWGWDEEWQADYFWRKFDISDKRIVQYEGEDIGCLEIEDRGGQIFLSYIAIAPEFQGKGIGTRLIEAVLVQGRSREVPVALKVLKANPAWKLYERLGFTVTATSETHYWMIAHPQPTNGQESH